MKEKGFSGQKMFEYLQTPLTRANLIKFNFECLMFI